MLVFPSHSLFTGIRFTRYDALQHYTMMLSVGGRMVNPLNAVGHGPDDKTDILGANFSHGAGSKMRQSCASRWCRTTGSCTSDESYYSASRPPGQRHSQVQRLGAGVHTSACVSARYGLQQCSWPQGLRPITVQFHNSNSSKSIKHLLTGASCPRVRARISASMLCAWTSLLQRMRHRQVV